MSIEVYTPDGNSDRFKRLVKDALDRLPTPRRQELESLSPRIHCISAKRKIVKFRRGDMAITYPLQLQINIKAEYFAKADDISVIVTLLHEVAHQLGVDDEDAAERWAWTWMLREPPATAMTP